MAGSLVPNPSEKTLEGAVEYLRAHGVDVEKPLAPSSYPWRTRTTGRKTWKPQNDQSLVYLASLRGYSPEEEGAGG